MGVARALADGLAERAAVIDCDVHQGNGTAATFAADDRVFTFSIHQEFNYPFEKPPSDLDIGLPNETDGRTYLSLLGNALVRVLDGFGPGLVVYVAGADPYRKDLLGGLALDLSDMASRDRMVMEACAIRKVPFTVTLAGGYAADTADTVAIQSGTVTRAIAVGKSL